jgi:anti-sigma B factor antagonist
VNSAKDFKSQVVPFLSQAGHVIIDLEDVTFVDSSGFGVLLACLRQVQSNGGELRLCGLHTPVRMLFEVVRMNRLFTICENREEAVKSFAPLKAKAQASGR